MSWSKTTAESFINKLREVIADMEELGQTYTKAILRRMFFKRITDKNFVNVVSTIKINLKHKVFKTIEDVY